MSRKIILTLAARREATAAHVQWGLHWAGIAAQQEQRHQETLLAYRHFTRDAGIHPQYKGLLAGAWSKADRVATVATTVRHETTVRPAADGKHIASCSCSWSSRPLTERGAKGQATRHVNQVTAALPAAA